MLNMPLRLCWSECKLKKLIEERDADEKELIVRDIESVYIAIMSCLCEAEDIFTTWSLRSLQRRLSPQCYITDSVSPC
jgi:hypothetical protein